MAKDVLSSFPAFFVFEKLAFALQLIKVKSLNTTPPHDVCQVL